MGSLGVQSVISRIRRDSNGLHEVRWGNFEVPSCSDNRTVNLEVMRNLVGIKMRLW